MTIEDLHNGFFRLTATNGVKDIRNGVIHSEVVCKENNIKFFVASE